MYKVIIGQVERKAIMVKINASFHNNFVDWSMNIEEKKNHQSPDHAGELDEWVHCLMLDRH